jgi:hypothetical protein
VSVLYDSTDPAAKIGETIGSLFTIAVYGALVVLAISQIWY